MWFGPKKNRAIWVLGPILLLPYARGCGFRPATRRFYGAPAAGSATRSAKRHQEVIDYVFDETKDNFIRK